MFFLMQNKQTKAENKRDRQQTMKPQQRRETVAKQQIYDGID